MNVELRWPQCEVFRSDRRFRVLVAGRRFGKTYLALVELCRAAWGSGRTVWYVAPTYKQAKRVAWRALKEMTREFWEGKPNETDLSIRLRAGGTIALRGADNYDSLRGEIFNRACRRLTDVRQAVVSDRIIVAISGATAGPLP